MLLGVFFISLAALIVATLEMPIPQALSGGVLEPVLTSAVLLELTKVISSGVAVGCLVFFMSEYIPRKREASDRVGALNTVLASVVHGLKHPGFFNHEYPATYFHSMRDHLLKPVEQLRHSIEARKISVAALKCGTEVASTRYEDFRGCLVLAAQISPRHALQWLELTDRVRLLAEEYERFPAGRIDVEYSFRIKPSITPLEYSETQMFFENCGVRLARFLVSAQVWLELRDEKGSLDDAIELMKLRAFLGQNPDRNKPQ